MKKIFCFTICLLMLLSTFPSFAFSEINAAEIVVDGKINEAVWDEEDWTEVDQSNGFWQDIPKTSDKLSYKFRLVADDKNLYGAFEVNADAVEGGTRGGNRVATAHVGERAVVERLNAH